MSVSQTDGFTAFDLKYGKKMLIKINIIFDGFEKEGSKADEDQAVVQTSKYEWKPELKGYFLIAVNTGPALNGHGVLLDAETGQVFPSMQALNDRTSPDLTSHARFNAQADANTGKP